MRLLLKLFLLFTLVPIVELLLLFVIADYTSWKVTLALVIATGIGGAWLARNQGGRAIRRLREQLRAGQIPDGAITDSALILVASALLLTPGVLTDIFALTLMIPWTRSFYRRAVRKYFREHVRVRAPSFPFTRGPETFDAEYRQHPSP